MTAAALLIFGAAVLATLALGGWVWVWFAVRHEASAMYALGEFDGMHFDSAIPGPSRGSSASLVNHRVA